MSTVRMSELLEQARSFDSSKLKPQTTSWAPLQEGVNEAVSPEQQAAIAISKKNKSKNKDEETEIEESGHTDVASAITNVKVAMSALTKMSGELSKLSPEDSLPSWWTNKVAVAVDKLDGMADYLDAKVESVKLDELVPTSRHVGKSKKNKDMFAVFDTNGEEVKLFKDEDDAREYSLKNHDKLMGHDKKPFKKEEVEPDTMNPRDHVAKSKKNPDMFCVFDTKGNEVKLFKDRKDAEEYAIKNHDSLMSEEVELDEVFNGTKKDIRKITRATDNALRKRSTQIQKMLKSKTNEKGRGLTDFEFDHISDEGDAIAAELVYRKKRGKDPISDDIPSHLKKFVNEEVELDEAVKISHVLVDTANRNEVVSMASSEEQVKQSKNSAERPPMSVKNKNTLKVVALKKPLSQKAADKLMGQSFKESAELDTMKAYASGISRILGTQGIEVPINELIDPADVDDDASSKDVALASKNIILQLKKSVDMNGKKDVEFASGKQKVPAAIAQKILDVHSKMKPQDKMKFQTTIAKSYKGLLNAIKGK